MEDWIIGLILALFVIVPCWLAILRGKETQRQVEAWPELAQRTGLTYTPATKPQKWWDSSVYPPNVHGEYRGRYLSLDSITMDRGRIDIPVYQNTSISLNVENYAPCSLSIQAKNALDYIRKPIELPSGNLDFDRCFTVTGSPREYVLAAADRIIHSDPRLFAWIMQKFPSIELKGENLVCDQNGELTNVDDQIALLNLLCDLAELAENLGSNQVKRG
jgi:hypothetical protein